ALLDLLDRRLFTYRADRLRLGDIDLLTLSARARRQLRGQGMAAIFQDPSTALDPVSTVGRQLQRVVRRQLNLSTSDARKTVLQALQAVGFEDPQAIARSWPHELSGGMRQRIMIAHAHALRPRLLIADEPTTALDTGNKQRVLRQLQNLQTEHGTAVLLITHDLRLLPRIADQVLVMRDGRLVEQTKARALFQAPQHEYSRQLLADLPPAVRKGGPMRAARENNPLLTVEGLTVTHRSNKRRRINAVKQVSFEILEGEILGLTGVSGAGKSTLARTLLQLHEPDQGSIRLRGQELIGANKEQLQAARRAMQIVFQDPLTALSPRRSIYQLLQEPARHFGLDDSHAHCVACLAAVELEADVLSRKPAAFSSGQRQRIALARALISDPAMLIADETLSALDVSVQQRIVSLLQRLCRERNISLLLVCHDLALLQQLADRTAVMQAGKLVELGPTRRLLDQPSHEHTRELVAAQLALDATRPAAPARAVDP
ncbi:MAG: ABC transporter ATP-binding protein, partial [Xanthomonadales bacterium]|nr:ABC transporter ATP-binding protein [Xanthomonadales bacterium]